MKKAFTLVELIAVIAILGLIIVIGVPKLMGTMKGQKEKSYEKVKDFLISAARNYVIDENIEGSASIEINDLCKYIDCPVINPITETEMQGCVNVKKVNGVDEYEYSTDCGYTRLDVNLNGGETNQEFRTNYIPGEVIRLLNPEKEGETFTGWEVTSGDAVLSGVELTIGHVDSSIVANFGTMPSLMVDLDGGTSNQLFESTYPVGEVIELEAPTKSGYSFAGWLLINGNSNLSGNVLTIGTKSTIIRAKYGRQQYTCTAGYYLPKNSVACAECPEGNFCLGGSYNFNENIDQGISGQCHIGTYSLAGAGSCTPCQNGKTTSGLGQTSCNANCSNTANVSTWATATWSASGPTNICTPASCNAGFDLVGNICGVKETNFAYTGGEQTYVTKAAGYYKLEVWGAAGGNISLGGASASGGKGGYASGVFHFNANETLRIYVGQLGQLNSKAYNGGGKGYGGGATDIRYNGTAYANRIIVGGAGGGGSIPEMCGAHSGRGGKGGNATGEGGTRTVTCVGACAGVCVSFYIGDAGSQSGGNAIGVGGDAGTFGGGGGGGYYGGKSGSGGGGGSSFISGYSAGGCSTAQGKTSISSSWTQGAQSGNGKAKITFCGASAC